MTLPVDDGLPGLSELFDAEKVWQTYCGQFGLPETAPQRIRARQIRYQPRARALVSYAVEWRWDQWVTEEQFTIELAAGKPERHFRYPDDPYLPGLHKAASVLEAPKLLAEHLLIPPQLLQVEGVRYRPGNRAVLRYVTRRRRAHAGEITLFLRVMPPARVPRFLAAARLAEHSGFALPRVAGRWPEGGVVWLTGIPGDTVRTHIRRGDPPDPEPILDGLARLWSATANPDETHPLDLRAGFRTTQRLLSHLLQGQDASGVLDQVTEVLEPFSNAWRPSALAHNDFYDDQVLLTPQGHLALVDFEETGPGDPLFDVGNMLAHLRWMARFGIASKACDSYRHHLRSAALERFDWDARALDLREAFAIFRLSPNPFRRLQRNWPQAIETGLRLVADVLDGEL